MAETLGMLCDKLTIVKLKEYHTDDPVRLKSLQNQAMQLQEEIDEYVFLAIDGTIPRDRLTFAANKVYKKQGNEVPEITGNIGELFSKLAEVNCQLWHEVEKGYDIVNVPVAEKDNLVKTLAVLNLQRNECIDAIDRQFLQNIDNKNKIE